MQPYPGLGRVYNCSRLLNMFLPVLGVVFGRIERVWLQHLPVWLLLFPQPKTQLITANELKLLPFEGTIDRLAGALLPDAARLFIPQKSVSIVDASEPEVQQSPVDNSVPHQSGMT